MKMVQIETRTCEMLSEYAEHFAPGINTFQARVNYAIARGIEAMIANDRMSELSGNPGKNDAK